MNRILRLTSAALLLGSVAPAHAQHTAIQVGQSVNGTLDGLDPLPSTRGRFEVFQFEGRAGERITATVRSDSFDAYLRLARVIGGITDEIESDDDGGGGTDARIRSVLSQDGVYLLIVQSLTQEGAGPFTLYLDPTPEPTTAEAIPLGVGQTVVENSPKRTRSTKATTRITTRGLWRLAQVSGWSRSWSRRRSIRSSGSAGPMRTASSRSSARTATQEWVAALERACVCGFPTREHTSCAQTRSGSLQALTG